jgi:hypothetical protein
MMMMMMMMIIIIIIIIIIIYVFNDPCTSDCIVLKDTKNRKQWIGRDVIRPVVA